MIGQASVEVRMPVQMELSRIFIREMTEMQIIELTEVRGERSFPIVIGLTEAFAIERRLKGYQIPRPQTHDLLATVMKQLGGRLKRILINDLVDGTFYARLVIEQNGRDLEIDSRPSDAIALGVAEGVPIFVDEGVLDQIQNDATQNIAMDEEEEGDEEGEGGVQW
jgi:bifunctional DNase/RNase